MLTIILAGCSTERDGFSYRTYHNTTTRFNGLFYAKESMREAQIKLTEEHEEDWDKILPLFIMGSEEAQATIFPEMERIIEKTQKVIAKHNMEPPKRQKKDLKRPELNKWMDDSYLLLGQAYYYKSEEFRAEEFIKFAVKKYKSPQMQAVGNAWLAKVQMDKEEWKKAKLFLEKAKDERDAENADRAEVYMTYADFYLRQGELKEAGKKLETAIGFIDRKKDRARPLFILAQIKQELGKSQDAIDLYRQVVKCRPIYEMEFYARINQALAFSRRGGNPEEIRETLYKMLKDDKNEEYRDQIYYALADLDLEERNKPGGIDNLNRSLRANVDNTKQLSKSYLRLADLYFDERNYESAQAYYDSCFQNIAEDHDRYKDVKNKATSLTELVTHLNVIYTEDSLQALCNLSDVERIKRLEEIQKQLEEELIAEREKAEREAQAALDAAAATGTSTVGSFWPYNELLRKTGYDNFIDFWGDRELEDNWRRRNKGFAGFDDGGGDEDPDDEEGDDEVVAEDEGSRDDVPTLDQLMDGLPCSESQLKESDEKIAGAYYESGLIYKEKLEDEENAVESWQVMSERLEDSEFHAIAFYQLYRTLLSRELDGNVNPFGDQREKSSYWANLIKQRYPESIYAQLIDNPDYKDEQEQRRASELAYYESVYDAYVRRQYVDVIQTCNQVIETEEDNHLICKYRFMRAVCIGNMDRMTGQRQNYIDALGLCVESCPESEEGKRAQELLDALDDESGSSETVPEPDKEPDIPKDSPFKFDANSQHYFALVFNMDRANVNQVKATVSDFNKKSFGSNNLITAANLLGREKHIVLVKSFNKIDQGMTYLGAFRSNTDDLKEFNDPAFETFIISKSNYLALFKSKDLEGYQSFFEGAYGP